MKMTKQEAGRLGGLSTYRKYGSNHMQHIGRLGGLSFWSKYKLIPVNTSDFLIVTREDNKIIGKLPRRLSS